MQENVKRPKLGVGHVFYKPFAHLSILTVPLLRHTPITPNMITLFNLFVMIPATIWAALAERFVLVSIFLCLYLFLDESDGRYAKTYNMTSELGAKLDVTSDFIMYSVGYAVIGYKLGTNIVILVLSMTFEWLYCFMATKYIAPTIRKTTNFRKTKIKMFFSEKLNTVFGMDHSLQDLIIIVCIIAGCKEIAFAIAGVLWLLDLIYRLAELYFLNLRKAR